MNDVIAQNRSQALVAGFPPEWKDHTADYGLDPRVIASAGQDNFGGRYARTLKADLQSIPTMSIVMSIDEMFGPQGLYSNPEFRGDAWERPALLELVYPDGRKGFQENADIRIQGGAFRRFDLTLKKSFRMLFREEYGSAKLRYPLFGPQAADEYDNLVLRATSNDAWPYLWRGRAMAGNGRRSGTFTRGD